MPFPPDSFASEQLLADRCCKLSLFYRRSSAFIGGQIAFCIDASQIPSSRMKTNAQHLSLEPNPTTAVLLLHRIAKPTHPKNKNRIEYPIFWLYAFDNNGFAFIFNFVCQLFFTRIDAQKRTIRHSHAQKNL
jgi:hypothetical protein